jgi:DNA invertase Pin-like site-specific DNA recombinase
MFDTTSPRAALNAKKTRGEKLGRPVSLTPSQIREAVAMIDDGKGASYVARLFNVDRATLYRALLRKVAVAT